MDDMELTNAIVSYLSVTKEAKKQIESLLLEREDEIGKKPIGIRLALKPQGCSGMKYGIEYAEEGVNISQFDDLFIEDDIKIFLDPKISMWVVGTQMDFEDDGINAGFIFKNPNEKGKCGCGESFYV
jgi:iron-sulfur cluster assembly protein